MVRRITQLSQDRPIVEADGSLTTQSRTFFKTLSDQASIVGIGSPEGVVEAGQLALYMDETGTTGNILYIKRDNDDGLGDKSKGWILV